MSRTALLLLILTFVAPRLASADDPPEPRIELHWNTCGNQAIEPYTPTDHVLLVMLAGAEGDYSGIEVTISVDGRCTQPCFVVPAHAQSWGVIKAHYR